MRQCVIEFQAIVSDMTQISDHDPNDCYNCQFSVAAKANDELIGMMNNCMSHICAKNPLIMLMGEDGVKPVIQSLFDIWCMASLAARKATINEIERGELEVWVQSEKATGKAAGQTGK